jgi:hypothetical protein
MATMKEIGLSPHSLRAGRSRCRRQREVFFIDSRRFCQGALNATDGHPEIARTAGWSQKNCDPEHA